MIHDAHIPYLITNSNHTPTPPTHQVGNEATVLGFVGLPYTLATYLVEGKSSKVIG